MKPPYFVRFLPQRAAAFEIMRKFALKHNDGENVEPSEVWDGARRVSLIAATFEGREFGLAYEWTPEQVVRYTPARAEPVFTSSARWPAVVPAPLREIRR